MKTKILLVALMMLSTSATFANDTLRSVVVVLEQDKSLISEIAITEISEKGRMTIVYDTIQKFKVLEDAKPWITQDLAYQLVEINNDPNLYGKHVWLPEDLKIYPKWSNVFVRKYTEIPHKLVISKNGIVSYELTVSMRREVKNPDLFIAIIYLTVISLAILLLAILWKFARKYLLIGFLIGIPIIWISSGHIWQAVITASVIWLPGYIASFIFFQTRLREEKLKKHGWQVEKPLKVFENGDLILVHKIHINGEPPIRLFDKKYRMKEYKPYSCEEMRWMDGLFYLIYDREKMTYGLFDVLTWEMVLEIKYKSIRNQTGRYILSTKVEGEKSRLFDLNDRIFLSDAKAI